MIFIIYLYLLSGVSKNLPQRTAACMLRPYCYLLFVMIAHAQGCLAGASIHVLRPYCYLLFVICYDCARTGLPRRGRTDMCYDLIVICYLLFVMIAHGKCAPLLKEKMFHGGLRFNRNRRPFALQSIRDSISIVDLYVSRCVTADSDHAGNASDRPLS